MREEKKLYLAFKSASVGSKARVKLTFELHVPKLLLQTRTPQDHHRESPSHMVIDDVPLVLEGNELS